MTQYQKIKAAARAKGIDTRKDGFASGGYWLTKTDGTELYEDENFCSSLKELKAKVEAH